MYLVNIFSVQIITCHADILHSNFHIKILIKTDVKGIIQIYIYLTYEYIVNLYIYLCISIDHKFSGVQITCKSD